MRSGQNPAKSVNEVVKPQRITVAVLNYIPFLSGYYADMLNVLKTCLGSLWANTDLPYDLMVFDNGSCAEVKDYLNTQVKEGRIQYLILSEKNLGKGGAWNIMLKGAPGEIIAYTDNDCYFYPGWLSHSLEVLEAYPNVGMVTSRPFRMKDDLNSATFAWAEQTPEVSITKGWFITWEDFRDFNMSIGNSEEEVAQWYKGRPDVHVTYHGVTAQVGASHYQFLSYKSVAEEFLPFEMDRPMGQVRQLDVRMNEKGYLRLMTSEPFMKNMSNNVPDDLRHKFEAVSQMAPARHSKKRLFETRIVKGILLKVYDWIFSIYYRN